MKYVLLKFGNPYCSPKLPKLSCCNRGLFSLSQSFANHRRRHVQYAIGRKNKQSKVPMYSVEEVLSIVFACGRLLNCRNAVKASSESKLPRSQMYGIDCLSAHSDKACVGSDTYNEEIVQPVSYAQIVFEHSCLMKSCCDATCKKQKCVPIESMCSGRKSGEKKKQNLQEALDLLQNLPSQISDILTDAFSEEEIPANNLLEFSLEDQETEQDS
ncbi:hypothetical protein TNCV_388401 [Trichonephila clavipes]|nr:hypothetical protein TNCV_388401 [Trichonephila clavipes]